MELSQVATDALIAVRDLTALNIILSLFIASVYATVKIWKNKD